MTEAAFAALLESNAEDLYDNAPCGYVSTLLDGTIVKINATLRGWLGYDDEELVGRRRFPDLLTVGGRVYYETHFAPLLHMQGSLGGVALELRAADGTRLPVLLTSVVKTGPDVRLIRTTVFDASDRRAYEEELLRARQKAERERDRAQELARTLQRTLLPPTLAEVPGVEVDAYYHPASLDQVGGDFYDLFPLSGGAWGFFLGDVSGKGADAAVVTSLARYTLRAAAVHETEPVGVLNHLNTVLTGTSPRFLTVLCGRIRPTAEGASVVLANGGHTPPVLIRADGTASLLHLPDGQLVGMLPNARFSAAEVHLEPGDTLLLYTDGVTEARIDGNTRYSEEALCDELSGLAPAGAPAVIEAVTRLLTRLGAGVEDDTALLALGIPVSAGRSR
ncbi:sigma-B regulation protein RsbU (phosphoserine phosphatase) [Lentzea xinjiangensis]|uniref:Sigma-B regulation protein RsbU (Phosphoserine phosphatase) n=1 Tax=Lentzea xinjiangensis TaxID=402600 RepID=A0A1H9WIB1_9PSEU|nr:SpoIIE family protein phosphatase [Lentzea xinjiangensis]SES33666.1 sigma-B regulation protein RsbU (phosphoserine phosphatase) [Lentzea xinjiangensis]